MKFRYCLMEPSSFSPLNPPSPAICDRISSKEDLYAIPLDCFCGLPFLYTSQVAQSHRYRCSQSGRFGTSVSFSSFG